MVQKLLNWASEEKVMRGMLCLREELEQRKRGTKVAKRLFQK